ncbi:MAG: hypothetical protein GF332_03740 [Candidatus Moranbacteria bacterium]|nr:hypothetical protein [Candidatus Moranbacteria bacterium]
MKFEYKAKKQDGGIQKGTVTAKDQHTAMEMLKNKGLEPFYFEEQTSTSKLEESLTKLMTWVSAKDMVVFSRQLAVLIESRVPIVRALKTISQQTENPTLRIIAKNMAKNVEQGDSLSEAMTKNSKYFDQFFISVVKSGEASGDLLNSLRYLADHIESDYELKRKVQGAMTYPAFILVAFAGIFLFLTIKVLPQLTEILKESDVDLPWTTQIVIKVSDFMEANWVLVLILFFGVVGFLVYYFKSDLGKRNWDTLILKVPVIGKLVRYSYIVRFSENLGVLMSQGVSIVKSLGIMAEIMGNEIYRDIMIKIRTSVEKGQSMTDAMYDDEEAFPLMVPYMIKIGEDTGRTSQILKNIETFYKREVNNMTENMTAIIEPFLIIILGIGTGVLVASIIMPIYDMAGSI